MDTTQPPLKRRKALLETRDADDSLEMQDSNDDQNSSNADDSETSGYYDAASGSSRRASSIGGRRSRSSASKSMKMYELDPSLYPEAAAARASYENRLRKKAEKNIMLDEIADLKIKIKALDTENELLREQLSNIEAQEDAYDWLNFFRDAGIKPGIDLKYALIFERNRVKPQMLKDLTETNLRDMRISAMGDIFAILKYARATIRSTGNRMKPTDGQGGSPRVSSTSTSPPVRKEVKRTVVELDDTSEEDYYEDENEESQTENQDNGLRIVHVRSLSELD